MTTGAGIFLQFSKPFVDAAKNIFETMIFSKLEPQKPFLKTDSTSNGDISAILGIVGDVKRDDQIITYKAMLVISFPYQTYFKVASAMLMEEVTEYSSEIADIAGEICNMVMGNAKKDLNEIGYSSNMAVPSMIEGKNHSIQYPSKSTIIAIPIKSAHGNFFIELCYKEAPQKPV